MVTSLIKRWISRIPADFGRTSPHVHLRLFGPVLAIQAAWALHARTFSPWNGAGIFVSGLLSWTLLEYGLHRFSFHTRSQSPFLKPFNSGLHLLHHRSPSDQRYIASPVILALPVYLLLVAGARLVLGSPDRALFAGSGLLLGFLIYEQIHYRTHLKPAKSAWMRHLKRHHMAHHFVDSQNLFGVTSDFWDRIFGTSRARDRASKRLDRQENVVKQATAPPSASAA
jgi:sterol desaturase/sphingolipid hydroxylase (fatty acid hydroxylase superfamily)